ncbi:MAG: hypothetical protein ABIN89_27140 [Chitinophagaceae bacterium]
MFAIKKQGASNFTEVHILSAAHTYQQFILNIPTVLGPTDNTWEFALAANRDLFAIKKQGGASNFTEVHILSAASTYQQFILNIVPTALHPTDNTWTFALAKNRDLFAIKTQGGGTNSTELHVLSAVSNYQEFILQEGTALHPTDVNWEFAVAANRDVFAIKKQGGATNSTEVHVLSALSNYKQFILQEGTALHPTDINWGFAITAGRDLFAIKKMNTGSNSTEIHIIDIQ